MNLGNNKKKCTLKGRLCIHYEPYKNADKHKKATYNINCQSCSRYHKDHYTAPPSPYPNCPKCGKKDEVGHLIDKEGMCLWCLLCGIEFKEGENKNV